ncbi:class I SAM-dependent RNA methyltransferase [Altericroceibacterium spongiae]|uniref:Class I SAM-dependent RNA methyltransferase n=1 Tax=Altericroceibacterium spongiae TaxID=2320269 RepID=A0A420ERB9_9SPHN|nr:class I SAM-dependent RNA methyltransferase [Altericroceibacterium spongiae]RKF23232.1 class I SAM-dependent RNA methyltransferase [Altericroceibacterium spongiae]
MSDIEIIERVAAKGDGVTATGRHIPMTAPGDRVMPDGTIEPGPHHAAPPCRHFGICGGCQLQHLDDEALSQFVHDRVVHAARGQGLEPEIVGGTHLSPPLSRRRASLKAVNGGGRPLIGFREAGSHKIVDLRECHILVPELFALVAPLRAMLAKRKGKYALEIELVLTDQGVDCAIKGLSLEGLEQTEAVLDFCRDNGIARMTLDQGYGPEAFWEPDPVTVSPGGVPVPYPAGAFLQATRDGEDVLAAAAREWLEGARVIADLFAGLGTFAFVLADPARVLAAEAARDAHLACQQGAARNRKPVKSFHRDLFRNPLRAEDLGRFDGVVLDPPRAGAREQVAQLAQSGVERIVYISCNPSSWARDCKTLIEAGYRLKELRPVGQFRWSTHVELASFFIKDSD